MESGCWRNLLVLLAALVLVAKLGHFQRWGGFQEKAMSQKNMNSTLKFFIENYNNMSNDTYLFRVEKLLRSHMQVCAPILAHLDMWGYGVASRDTKLLFHQVRSGYTRNA